MDPVLEQILLDILTRLGTEFKSVRTDYKGLIGNISNLTTTQKADLVSAINEVKASISSAAGISDGTTSTSSTWSSQKITDYGISIRDGILGGASAAYDTLQEIQAALQGDDVDIAALTTAIGNRVRFDAAQTLTAAQQTQARANINAVSQDSIGNLNTDFLGAFNAALA